MPDSIKKKRMLMYVQRLICRRNTLFEQIENEKLVELKQILLGEVKGMDLVIKEMIKEFDLPVNEFKGL
ncbi:hypothetical protein JCM9157_2255 [Halalkalibacter akibai JCM 9157]|uniref:Uncharacterized protein n=1 Tax=Halalkalibacter akibai (strain ATCC 43226 / DSM 21942 / CIP 109018 / JCM 9157 / 1139) TaxID=1236973 RepID=W4QSQ1_HALA3|nr:hypothetical protein JCM9157_2255 [Halalkalibacter akibai JCM 9157]